MDQPFLFVWKFLNKRISQRNVRQENCLEQKILFFSSLTHEWTDTIRFSYNTAQFLLASSARFTVDLKKEIKYDGINSKTENTNNNQINLIQYVQYKLLTKVPSPYNIKGLLHYTDLTAWKIWMVPTYWDLSLLLVFLRVLRFSLFLTRNLVDEEPLFCGCATSKSLFIYLFIYLLSIKLRVFDWSYFRTRLRKFVTKIFNLKFWVVIDVHQISRFYNAM